MKLKRTKLTALEISGVEIPAGSDIDVSGTIAPIAEAADLRRSVNYDLSDISRPGSKKYGIDISGSDTHLPGIAGLMPGDYVEVIPHEPLSFTVHPASASVTLIRAGVDVVGITSSGRRVSPLSQPPEPYPLEITKSAFRFMFLRMQRSVTFAEPVSLVKFRPCFACLVMSWSTSSDERTRDSGWQMRVEEA